MKGMAIVDKGLEDVAIEEINEKIKSKGKKAEYSIIFDIAKEEDLCKLAYTSQSVRRIMLLLKEFKVEKNLKKSISQFQKDVKKDLLKKYISKNAKIECERIGEHDFNSVDFAREVSKILHEQGFEVSRTENEITFYIYINGNKGYLSLDFSGKDLSKREYRVFTKPGSLKGTLAYALVRIAHYKPGEIILDPYCESGVVPIEATLMAINKPVHFYKKDFAFKQINKKFEKVFKEQDKKIKKKEKGINALDKTLGNVNSAKKNAKIAGVDKIINFSKADIEWLDTKFDKESVDKVITKLPAESKRFAKNKVELIYKELFYQLEFILKKNGTAVICTMKNELLKQIASEKKFKTMTEQTIFSGQQEFTVTTFQKN
ncbi:MAG: hypothetical protein ABIB43_05325 [archaeon]